VNIFQEGGSKLQALESELKAKEKEEAEAVASHKANHDSIVSEEKKKKQLEQGLHVVRNFFVKVLLFQVQFMFNHMSLKWSLIISLYSEISAWIWTR
jgi:hypothetical protein